jgi:Beta-galactosidase
MKFWLRVFPSRHKIGMLVKVANHRGHKLRSAMIWTGHRRVPGFWFCLSGCLLASAAGWCAPASPSIGVYALGKPNSPIPEAVLQNPNVDGIALRTSWDALEPAEGGFYLSLLDGEVHRARTHNKNISLSVEAGFHTPAWVFAAGAEPFYMVWDKPWGPPLCSQQRIPVPWDPVYVAKWQDFIRQLGRRYGSEPALSNVKLTGINSRTQEAILPHGWGDAARAGTTACAAKDDVAQWLQAGYTRTKVEGAWATIVQTFTQAFTGPQLAVMVVPGGFPPIDGQGGVIPHCRQDFEIGADLASIGQRICAKRFVLQNNGLSAWWAFKPPPQLEGTVVVGDQMVWAATGDSSCRMNRYQKPCEPRMVLRSAVDRGIAAGASFLEIYIADILNPELQDVLAMAHRRLARNVKATRSASYPGAPEYQ